MLREDWELMTAPTMEGAEPMRVTREIQHDVLPQFLSPTRLLGLIGEPRHRRSHLYDLTSGARTRLFHNNTVRTVAPVVRTAVGSRAPGGGRRRRGRGRGGGPTDLQ